MITFKGRNLTKIKKRKFFVKIKQNKKNCGQHCPIIFGGEGEIRLVATASKFALGGSVSLGRGFGGICATHNPVVLISHSSKKERHPVGVYSLAEKERFEPSNRF